uniref:Chemokine interleukin-8-like domain-containing protein n=1 Tax=Oreochromis niloticus TaxID=8128 RepID=A0A669BKP2_ORENI
EKKSTPPGLPHACCIDVTKNNQAARQHCVKAIIFNTKNGKQLCADPDAQWVKDRKLRKHRYTHI